MARIIDAHQHFWTYGTYQTSWMDRPPYTGNQAFTPLRRSFTPADLAPSLKVSGIDGTVVIQAGDGSEENEALLTYAKAHDWIASPSRRSRRVHGNPGPR